MFGNYTPSNFDFSGQLPRCLRNQEGSLDVKPFPSTVEETSFNDMANALFNSSDESDASHKVKSYLNQFIGDKF